MMSPEAVEDAAQSSNDDEHRMNRRAGIAAVVLAAGRSTRMGRTKPLLPLDSQTAIERLIGSCVSSGVADTVVVTGHDPDRLLATLAGLDVRPVHNPRYESGMFSSVRAGVAALRDDVEAFFIMPADHPLIRGEVLDRLTEAFRRDGSGVVHPVCCGVRGHPPLVAGRFREALLGAEAVASLRDFFLLRAEDEVEIEVEDVTVLMDMDTEEDYRRFSRFADLIDATAEMAAGPGDPGKRASNTRGETLSTDDCHYLLSLLEVPPDIIRHCEVVALVGETLGKALRPYVPDLDINLIRTAGLLHDLAKAVPRHAVAAENILRNLGLSRLGSVVGAHMVLPVEQEAVRLPTEEQLVYLADKLVIKDEVAGVDARAARALSKHGNDAVAVEGITRRMETAEMIRDRVETLLQRSLEEVLPRDV
jgi:molybdenum cofactor cytidylyltransferase